MLNYQRVPHVYFKARCLPKRTYPNHRRFESSIVTIPWKDSDGWYGCQDIKKTKKNEWKRKTSEKRVKKQKKTVSRIRIGLGRKYLKKTKKKTSEKEMILKSVKS